MMIAMRTPGPRDPDFAALEVLADVLNSRRFTLYGLVPKGKATGAEFALEPLPQAAVAYAALTFTSGDDPKALAAEVRAILEPEIAALAAVRISESELATMREAVAIMDRAGQDPDAYIEADLDFHLALAEGAANPLILSLLDSIVENYKPALDELSLEISGLEQLALQDPCKDTLNKILEVKKEVMHLRQIISRPDREYPIFGAAMELLDSLAPDKLAPAPSSVPERFERGTLPFADLAGMTAAVEHLAALAGPVQGEGAEGTGRRVGGGGRRERILASMAAAEAHEQELFRVLLGGLDAMTHVTTYGKAERRTATAYFNVAGRTPLQVAGHLAERRINVWDGDNYAWELTGVLGIRDSGAAVRAGLVHYNDRSDVDRLLSAVHELGAGS